MIEIKLEDSFDKDNINHHINLMGLGGQNKPQKTHFIQLYTLPKPLILDFKKQKKYIFDDLYYLHFPHLVRFDPNAISEEKKSNESTYIITKDSFLGIFYCDASIANIVKKSVFSILSKYINSKFLQETDNNILIKGRKVFIEKTSDILETVKIFIINMYYDHTLFQSILTSEELYGETGKGITGIQNEIPEYTKQQFLKDFYSEIGGIYGS